MTSFCIMNSSSHRAKPSFDSKSEFRIITMQQFGCLLNWTMSVVLVSTLWPYREEDNSTVWCHSCSSSLWSLVRKPNSAVELGMLHTGYENRKQNTFRKITSQRNSAKWLPSRLHNPVHVLLLPWLGIFLKQILAIHNKRVAIEARVITYKNGLELRSKVTGRNDELEVLIRGQSRMFLHIKCPKDFFIPSKLLSSRRSSPTRGEHARDLVVDVLLVMPWQISLSELRFP